MAINFPNSPTTGETFTENGVLYTWDGAKWTANKGNADLYVEKTGDTMTGELIVPSLSSDSGNLPIQRASVADSQVQSFKLQDDTADWYPFNPIPTWCNHIRYDIIVVLASNEFSNGGFYMRWGSAAGPLLPSQVSLAGTQATVLDNKGTLTYTGDPLALFGKNTSQTYYSYVMDYYIYNRGVGGVPGFWCYGIGSGGFNIGGPVQVEVSEARMITHHITPQAPNTVMPDRMGCLFYGGTAAGIQNEVQIKQTFLTDGPVGLPADLGPTPTPIS
jgi:hypothetical protein